MKPTLCIAWIAVRELLYEKVFYLLVFFAFLALGLSALLGQLTYAEQTKLTVDFMLGGIEISMILFSVFMGISLFQRELTSGSVSMVLSKPISRTYFLVGKYLGQIAVQTLVTFLMGAITLFACSRFGESVSYLAICQTLVLIVFEVAVLTAITYLFAVLSGAITTAIATLCLFALGHFRDSIGENVDTSFTRAVWKGVKGTIPDLEVFNMKALASYGHAISSTEMGWAAVYAGFCVVFYLGAAALCFEQKDILT